MVCVPYKVVACVWCVHVLYVCVCVCVCVCAYVCGVCMYIMCVYVHMSVDMCIVCVPYITTHLCK